MSARWHSTNSVGVRYRQHPTRKHGVKRDRYFSMFYRIDGRQREEGLGWSSEGMTEQKAAVELARLKEAHRSGKGPQTLAESRDAERARWKAEKAREAQEAKDAITFRDIFYDHYLPAQSEKAEKSIDTEKQLFETHLKREIGHLPLKSIATDLNHLENIKRAMARKGRAPRSILYALAVVSQVFNFCIDRNLFSGGNPTRKLKKPKVDNKRVRFLTMAEAETLVKALAEVSPDVADMTTLSLYAGLRAGEIFALTWGDVLWDSNVLFVKDTKTGENRQPPMTDVVKKMLRGREEGKATDLIFSGRAGSITSISRTFDRTVERLGFNEGVEDRRLKFVFHSCRHCYGSWLVQSGVNLYTVAKLMGHKTIAMTERYSHLSPEVFEAATNVLDKQVAKARRKSLELVKNEEKAKEM